MHDAMAWSLSSFFLSFSIYCQTLFRVLSAGVLCTLRVAGWKPTSNHIEITLGFFNLHRGWLSLHRGHPVYVPIRRTMHLSSVIPANDTRESVFGHRNFSRRERESNLGPLAPEATTLHLHITSLFVVRNIKCGYSFSKFEREKHFEIKIEQITRNFWFCTKTAPSLVTPFTM